MGPVSPTTTTTSNRVQLEIEGMTCASCAAHIEKRLNGVEGVTASVNYATESAVVTSDAPLEPDVLVAEVEAAGYRARLPRSAGGSHDHDHDHGADATRALRTRVVLSTVLTVPVLAMAM